MTRAAKRLLWAILWVTIGACSDAAPTAVPAGAGDADVAMEEDVLRVGPDISDDAAPATACATDADCVLALGPLPACQATLCDDMSGFCVVGPHKDHTPCDDGDLCTLEDTCQAGVCVGGYDRPCEDHNGCTDNSCDPATGCVFTANTAPCDDGNACTEGDVCADGSCLGAGSETCVCVADADCLPFDDDNLCNGAILCLQGTCALDPGTVISCDTSQDTACRRMTCNPTSGACELLDLSDLPCSDGNPCTAGDTCVAGDCVGAPSSCPCETVSDCEGFDDDDLCNGQVACVAGVCETDPATVVLCPPPETTCATVACVADTGACETTAALDGLVCDDGDLCTTGDACVEGGCEGEATGCDDGDPCTEDSCEPASGCVHEPVAGCGEPEPCAAYAAVFGGAGCVEVPDVLTTGLTAYTIEMWVRPDTEDQQGFILDKIQDKDYELPGFRVRYLTWPFVEPKPVLHYEEVKTAGNFHGLLTVDPYVASEWRHYVVVRRASGIIRLFIDGIAQGLNAMNAENFMVDQSNDHPLYIGCQDADGGFFEGRLDELRVSAGERYTSSFTPPTAPMETDGDTLLLYHFDEGAGEAILDSSGGGHHGVWVGPAAWTAETPVTGGCE